MWHLVAQLQTCLVKGRSKKTQRSLGVLLTTLMSLTKGTTKESGSRAQYSSPNFRHVPI